MQQLVFLRAPRRHDDGGLRRVTAARIATSLACFAPLGGPEAIKR
jgi:hypothetical protein